MNKPSDLADEKSLSWKMFDLIASRYDFLNRVLSFGQDPRWRMDLARYAPPGDNLRLLDLATGTADVLITLKKNVPGIADGVGLDMSEEMLSVGREKVAHAGLQEVLELRHGDAHAIPFENDYFDLITIAFGIRNMANPITVLKEMARVLKPGGRVLVLEFSRPTNPFIGVVHLCYLRGAVPLIGGLLTGHLRAYRYLNRTIERFAFGKRFCRMMEQVGLVRTEAHPLLWGTASIYQADKPS